MTRKLVAGIDSSTQSCKVVVRDADTGELVREGRAAHPAGTEVAPSAWAQALDVALAEAGGLGDVAAVSVAAQQHGMVCLDEDGEVVRPALLWNDTRSAKAADELVAEAGADGRAAWASGGGERAAGLVHREQVALAGRARAGFGRAHGRRRAAARLVDLAVGWRASHRGGHDGSQ